MTWIRGHCHTNIESKYSDLVDILTANHVKNQESTLFTHTCLPLSEHFPIKSHGVKALRTVFRSVFSENVRIALPHSVTFTLHFIRTKKTKMYKWRCTNRGVQTELHKPMCTNRVLQTEVYKRMCTNGGEETEVYKPRCTNGVVQTECTNKGKPKPKPEPKPKP